MGEANFYYFTCLNLKEIYQEDNYFIKDGSHASHFRLSRHLEASFGFYPNAPSGGSDGSGLHADNLEHAVGIEKFEKLAKLAGIDDPWDLKPFQLGAGTKEEPTLLPSMYNKRLVGHLCEDHQTHLTYFYVYKGFPKRCQCGHWFKVVDSEPYHY